MSTDMVASPAPDRVQENIALPAPESTPVLADVEPIGVEPLWEQLAALVAERKRNRFEIGRLLDELHQLCAKHGNGTYSARAAAICGSRSTASRWRMLYRQEAGLAPAPDVFDAETEIPFDPDEKLMMPAGPESDVADDVVPEERPEPTVCSVRVTLSPKEKNQWEAQLGKLVRFFKAVGMSREDGKVIDNPHDAAFFAVWSTAHHPQVTEWEAQHENKSN